MMQFCSLCLAAAGYGYLLVHSVIPILPFNIYKFYRVSQKSVSGTPCTVYIVCCGRQDSSPCVQYQLTQQRRAAATITQAGAGAGPGGGAVAGAGAGRGRGSARLVKQMQLTSSAELESC